jgi:hypothetical protein
MWLRGPCRGRRLGKTFPPGPESRQRPLTRIASQSDCFRDIRRGGTNETLKGIERATPAIEASHAEQRDGEQQLLKWASGMRSTGGAGISATAAGRFCEFGVRCLLGSEAQLDRYWSQSKT